MTDEPNRSPLILVLAGPNGAGKSTAAAGLLPAGFPCVNADEVAKTLPNYLSAAADLETGRRDIEQMDQLAECKASLAVETTLAGRTLTSRIAGLWQVGYYFRLAFLWAPNPAFCVERVANRVALGGHNIPPEVVRRRFVVGRVNFLRLDRAMADEWAVYDSSEPGPPKTVTWGKLDRIEEVVDSIQWRGMIEEVKKSWRKLSLQATISVDCRGISWPRRCIEVLSRRSRTTAKRSIHWSCGITSPTT